MAKIDFDDYAENYNDLVDGQLSKFESNSEYFADYKAALSKKLMHTSPERILEYGCGIGRNIKNESGLSREV